MNVKKVYYNAPAPLFALLLGPEERDVGFDGILCACAASLRNKEGATLEECQRLMKCHQLTEEQIERGTRLLEQYKGSVFFGIERGKFNDYKDSYHKDKDFVLLLAYMAIVSLTNGKLYAKCNNNLLLSRMSGLNSPQDKLHPCLAEYDTIYKMRLLKKDLTKFYHIAFNSNTRGFYVSIRLSKEELAAKVGNKEPKVPSIKKSKDTKEIDALRQEIAQKDALIAELQSKVAELTEKLNTKKATRKREFSKDVNSGARTIFEEFYHQKVGEPYSWSAKDFGQMTDILKKIRSVREQKGFSCEDQDILEALKLFFENIQDTWILGHLSVGTIQSKYNEIVSAARTAYNQKRKSASNYEPTGTNSGAYDNEDLSVFG